MRMKKKEPVQQCFAEPAHSQQDEAERGFAVNPGLRHLPQHKIQMMPCSCYFTCRCNRTRAEHESQQTQRYPAAGDPHRRVRQEELPGEG